MSLLLQITEDMKSAMKTKNNATLSTLRLLLSAAKNKKIDLQHELSDEEMLAVIKSQTKQLQDGFESFTSAGREDLAAQTKAEMEILAAYLPAQMSDEELTMIVKKTVADLGVTSKAEMGKVMGLAMKAVAGKADGTRVKQIVETLLGVFVLVGVGLTLSLPVHAATQTVAPLFPFLTFFTSHAFFGTALRVFRVLLIIFGILAVNMILLGGFSYMTASSRDDSHSEAMGHIARGIISSLAVVLLFSVTTIAIKSF